MESLKKIKEFMFGEAITLENLGKIPIKSKIMPPNVPNLVHWILRYFLVGKTSRLASVMVMRNNHLKRRGKKHSAQKMK